MAEAAVSKSISRFEPRDPLRLEEFEHHYVEVHTRFMRNFLRTFPTAVSYHQARVVAQYDLAGGWNAPLGAWRFVLSRYSGPFGERFAAMPPPLRPAGEGA